MNTKKKWLIWFVLTLTYMLCMLLRNVSGVLQKEFLTTFGMNVASYGLLASVYMYVFTAMQFVVGPTLDTKGPRMVVSVGMFIAGLGTLLFGCSFNVPMLFIGRILIAIGFAGAFSASVKVDAVNFEPAVFATVIGMTSFLGQFGSILSQTPLAYVCRLFGWRAVFTALGVAGVLLGAAVWKSLDDGVSNSKAKESFRIGSLINRQMLGELHAAISIPYMKHVVVNSAGGQGINSMLVGAWCVPFLRDVYEISLMQATGIMVFYLIGQMLGCLCLGIISDRLCSRKKVFIVSAVLAAAIFLRAFCIAPLIPYSYIKPVFFVFGFCSTNYLIRIAIGKELCGAAHTGSGFSIANAAGFLGAAVSMTVTGIIFKWSGGVFATETAYRIAFIPAAAAISIATAMLLLFRRHSAETNNRTHRP